MENRPKEHYTVAWISALPIESTVAECVLDEYHGLFSEQGDPITYILGSIRGHNIVIVSPLAGVPGSSAAARLTTSVRRTFKNICFGFLVGIGGGIPSERHDVRLGDVVVGIPGDGLGGVLPHDIGKHLGDGSFKITGHLNKPPDVVLSAVSALQSGQVVGRNPRMLPYITEMVERHPNLQGLIYDKTRGDELYDESGLIVDRTPRESPEPMIHYGIIASGDQLIKDANLRKRLGRDFNVLCVEMEATGVVDALPCLVIRGISDYADSYKNDAWKWYAAATAAAYAKNLLSVIGPLRLCEDSGHPRALPAVDREMFSVNFESMEILAVERLIGRDTDLLNLWDRLSPEASTSRKIAVVQGLGGLGKTQLAVHFVLRYKEEFSAIFWVNGKTRETACQSMASFLAKLPGVECQATNDQNVEEQAVQVLSWLSQAGNSKWLLVFDNVDGCCPSGAPDADHYDITRFFPAAHHGSILITTRELSLANRVGRDPYLIQKLPTAESIELLLTRAGPVVPMTEKDNPDVVALANRLDGLPLAVVLAGSYIRQTGVSVGEYLELYHSQWEELNKGLEPFGQYENGDLTTTWAMSVTAIKQRSPSAARLLLLLSCFDNHDIWYGLVRQGLDHNSEPHWLAEIVLKPTTFFRTMAELLNFSLITSERGSTYSMHPVVQDWCHSNMRPYMEEIVVIAMRSTLQSFPSKQDQGQWITRQRLYRHAHQIVQLSRNGQRQTLERMALYVFKLHDHYPLGQYPILANTVACVLDWCEKTLGGGHPVTYDLIWLLGSLYAMCDSDLASVVLDRLPHGFLRKHERPCLCESLVILPFVVLDMKRKRCEDVENAIKRMLAKPSCSQCSRGIERSIFTKILCSIYFQTGRDHEAEKLCQRLISEDRDQGRQFFEMTEWLALTYKLQHKLEDAEALFKRIESWFEKLSGTQYEETLVIARGLGYVQEQQGNFADAEGNLQRALEGYENLHGPDNLETLRIKLDLGVMYEQAGRSDAQDLLLHVLADYHGILGPDARGTLQATCRIGTTFVGTGKLKQAEKLLQVSLSAQERKFGQDDLDTRGSIVALAWCYQKQCRFREAEETLEKFRYSRTDKSGFFSPTSFGISFMRAELYWVQGKKEEAREMYEEFLVFSADISKLDTFRRVAARRLMEKET